MSNLTLVNQELPDFLRDAGLSELTKQLAGKSGKAGVKRIVPKNGIFRKIVGGEEMGKTSSALKTIIIHGSPNVGRIFYAKAWSPDAEPAAPDCFSNDGRAPDPSVQNPPASRCDSCPNNIKGSGQGTSKACRYTRRVALVLEEDFGTSLQGRVYQMNLASMSLFGAGFPSDNKFVFEDYTKYLANNGKSLEYLVTSISFNENNDNQSVLFTPIRYINKDIYAITSKAAERPEVQKMVVMTPYEAQMSTTKILPKPTPKVEAKAEAIAEPVKRPKTEAPVVASKKDLDDVLKEWSEE